MIFSKDYGFEYSQIETIDISNQPDGMYQLTIVSKMGVVNKVLLISK